MASLGLTRYGLSIEFGGPGATDRTTKSISGINFADSSVASISQQAAEFVNGNLSAGGYFGGLKDLLDTDYTINSVDVTSRNQVEGQAQ